MIKSVFKSNNKVWSWIVDSSGSYGNNEEYDFTQD
jgi:hypothetical protein